jgi:hypothetical protein
MDQYPYKVYNPAKVLVLVATEECRYPKLVELAMVEAGYSIFLHGKKLTKADIRKEADSANTRR